MSENLRDRIAAVLLPDLEYAAAYNPTSESPEAWAASLADAVIRELKLHVVIVGDFQTVIKGSYPTPLEEPNG